MAVLLRKDSIVTVSSPGAGQSARVVEKAQIAGYHESDHLLK